MERVLCKLPEVVIPLFFPFSIRIKAARRYGTKIRLIMACNAPHMAKMGQVNITMKSAAGRERKLYTELMIKKKMTIII